MPVETPSINANYTSPYEKKMAPYQDFFFNPFMWSVPVNELLP